MISTAIAPIQLPFAPRPISTELLSSWLLRVAAANLVSLWELLQGFEFRYGRVLTNVTVDYSLGDAAVAALSQFCRVAPEKIRALDLRRRSPHLSPGLLLGFRFQNALLVCPRYSLRRARYAFCPLCIARQRVLHVRWDWSVACLIHCAVHRTPLLDGCPACGEPDPLTFSGFDLSPIRLCRSCGMDLTEGVDHLREGRDKNNLQAIEDAYRAALLGVTPAPALLGKATDRAFRQFVEDMFQVLTRSLNPPSAYPSTSSVPVLRRDILQIIAALILNAAPSSGPSARCKRYARGLILWATLLKIIPEYEGATLEQSSRRWPVALRRRFVSALYYRTRKRWPHTPYRAAADFGNRFKYSDVVSVYDLSAGKQPSSLKFPI
jgi:hypothetical protein